MIMKIIIRCSNRVNPNMSLAVYRASLFYSNEYCAETTINDELIGEMAPASHHSSPTAFQIIRFLLEFG